MSPRGLQHDDTSLAFSELLASKMRVVRSARARKPEGGREFRVEIPSPTWDTIREGSELIAASVGLTLSVESVVPGVARVTIAKDAK